MLNGKQLLRHSFVLLTASGFLTLGPGTATSCSGGSSRSGSGAGRPGARTRRSSSRSTSAWSCHALAFRCGIAFFAGENDCQHFAKKRPKFGGLVLSSLEVDFFWQIPKLFSIFQAVQDLRTSAPLQTISITLIEKSVVLVKSQQHLQQF